MNPYVKSMAVVFLILFITLSAAGCGFKDIDKRLFVVSVGIDPAKKSPKKFLVHLKFAIPNEEGVSNESFIISQEGDTIAEAVRIIKSKVDKEIDFSHSKLIIYNEELLKPEIEPNLYYWFVRRRDYQETSWVAIGKPSALDVLKVKPKSERLPSNSLFLALGRDGTETAYIFSEYLFDLKKRFKEKGLDPLLPIIEAKKDIFEINKVGLFNKKSLRLSLPPHETMILDMFLNKESKTALKILNGDKVFVIDTQAVKIKYKIITKNQERPYVKVNVNINGRIEEALFSLNNNEIHKYQQIANKYTEKQFQKVLEKLQKANVDPIGFGLNYRGKHFEKNDWETWQKLYPKIEFKVNANINIKDTGLVE